MNHKQIIIVACLLFTSPAFAGGADETVDPRNGCYAKASTHSDGADQMADFVNHRGKYSVMVDDARFGTLTSCWENKSKCIRVQTVCRKDGNIVYDGFIWMWRDKKCPSRPSVNWTGSTSGYWCGWWTKMGRTGLHGFHWRKFR